MEVSVDGCRLPHSYQTLNLWRILLDELAHFPECARSLITSMCGVREEWAEISQFILEAVESAQRTVERIWRENEWSFDKSLCTIQIWQRFMKIASRNKGEVFTPLVLDELEFVFHRCCPLLPRVQFNEVGRSLKRQRNQFESPAITFEGELGTLPNDLQETTFEATKGLDVQNLTANLGLMETPDQEFLFESFTPALPGENGAFEMASVVSSINRRGPTVHNMLQGHGKDGPAMITIAGIPQGRLGLKVLLGDQDCTHLVVPKVKSILCSGKVTWKWSGFRWASRTFCREYNGGKNIPFTFCFSVTTEVNNLTFTEVKEAFINVVGRSQNMKNKATKHLEIDWGELNPLGAADVFRHNKKDGGSDGERVLAERLEGVKEDEEEELNDVVAALVDTTTMQCFQGILKGELSVFLVNHTKTTVWVSCGLFKDSNKRLLQRTNCAWRKMEAGTRMEVLRFKLEEGKDYKLPFLFDVLVQEGVSEMKRLHFRWEDPKEEEELLQLLMEKALSLNSTEDNADTQLGKTLEEALSVPEREPHYSLEEKYQERLMCAVEKYDLVIDIHSLRGVSFGWGIYGKRRSQAIEENKGDVTGRIVTVVGEYNTGKTWLIKMLLQNDLEDSQVVHTPGICMTFVESKQNRYVNHAVPTRSVGRGRGIGSRRRMSAPPKSSDPAFDYVILDSAGTEEACAAHNLKDMRATQIFIRKMLVEIADKLIFVTSKFNQPTQIAINSIIKQLSAKPGFEITPTNRLLVVHNLMEVEHQEVLERKIMELENVYSEPEEESEDFVAELMRAEKLQMRASRHVAAWQRVEETVAINGNDLYRFTYFNTRLTTHILLVKHSTDDRFAGRWRYLHNMAGFEILRTMIRYRLDSRKINLLQEVMRVAERELPKYLVGFDKGSNKLKMELYDEVPYIVPEKLPEEEKEEEDEDSEDDAKEWDGEIQPFKLRDMQFTDNDIIAEGDQYLHGSVFESKTQFVLKVLMPGVVSKKLVKVRTYDFRHVRIEVRTPAPFSDVPPGSDLETVCLSSDVQWGQSYFRWTAPAGKFFYDLKTAEKDAASDLSNGIFTLHLQKPELEEEPEAGEGEQTEGEFLANSEGLVYV